MIAAAAWRSILEEEKDKDLRKRTTAITWNKGFPLSRRSPPAGNTLLLQHTQVFGLKQASVPSAG